MGKAELIKLAEKYQAKADTDYQNYQETGARRYESSWRRNEDMAEAFRMAADAADEHQAYTAMRVDMANFARDAMKASHATGEEREKMVKSMIDGLVSSANSRNNMEGTQ